MEALIDTIVSRLKEMPISDLQTTLEFLNSLEEQHSQSEISSVDSGAVSKDDADKQTRWQTIVSETAGIWPDFPLAEELRSDSGEDAPREAW